MLKFGQRMRLLRQKREWKQEQVAKSISITPEMVSVYELGKSDPKLDTLVAIADLYDVSVDYLLGRTNIPSMADCQTTDIIDLLSLTDLSYEGKPLTKMEQDALITIVKTVLSFKRIAKPISEEKPEDEEPAVVSKAAYGDIEKILEEKIKTVKEELRQEYRKEKEEQLQDNS